MQSTSRDSIVRQNKFEPGISEEEGMFKKKTINT